MKANKLLLATALFTGLATFAFAGPSPQFWNQQELNRKDRAQTAAKVEAQAKVEPAAQVACANCNCNCAAMKKS